MFSFCLIKLRSLKKTSHSCQMLLQHLTCLCFVCSDKGCGYINFMFLFVRLVSILIKVRLLRTAQQILLTNYSNL